MNPVTALVTVAILALACSQAPAADPPGKANAAADSLNSLDGLRSRVRIGTEIFLDPGRTREDNQKHFAKMKDVGLTVARIFIIWDHVQRKPGEWRFDLYDHAYDAAAANGISVLTTLCPEDPPAWMRRTPFWHGKLVVNCGPSGLSKLKVGRFAL